MNFSDGTNGAAKKSGDDADSNDANLKAGGKSKEDKPKNNTAEENLVDMETHQRLKADFDNYRRRTQAEMQKLTERALSDFLETLLPVLEAFEAGMEYSSEELKPVYDLFSTALTGGGLQVINPEAGEPFDPQIHQAIEIESSEESEKVKEVVRVGYVFGDKLLRAAQVKVG